MFVERCGVLPKRLVLCQCIIYPTNPHGIGDIVGSAIYNGPTQTYIVAKLPRNPNIFRAELYAFLFAMQHTQPLQSNVHIFIDSFSSMYLLTKHIHHLSSQHNHPDKLLIVRILFHIQQAIQTYLDLITHNHTSLV